ncbi:protein C3orf33 homolog isoform X2 [Acanthochromis polyacanthus]|uniref:protein C3orf33 homolog isoform X2 n=1 Tax=Acanthochromis polyacanthus TaxID=80966 RepID=UPI002233F1A6|nr:protein C3orf33 homolog isoform X2 [Acanthochromis polyacanthus]
MQSLRPVILFADHRAETEHRPDYSWSVPPKEAERRMHRENVNNMPESSTETETEEGKRDRQQRDEATRSSRNVVSVISQFADDNLTLVRNISTGLAIAGVIVIARSIKLMTKFQTACQIPPRFIERNVSLRGKVHSITERGLEVEHVPIYLPVLSPLLSKHKDVSTGPLLVHLAGVELTPEGRVWLQQNVTPAQTVWLKLISREDDTLHCLVSQSRGSLWSYCLNEEVLRLGLARTAPIAGVLPDSRLYWHLHKRLHKAEVKAERKGWGLWKEDSLWERTSKAIRDSALFRLVRRIFKRT